MFSTREWAQNSEQCADAKGRIMKFGCQIWNIRWIRKLSHNTVKYSLGLFFKDEIQKCDANTIFSWPPPEDSFPNMKEMKKDPIRRRNKSKLNDDAANNFLKISKH